jgi:hypothetical protein
MPRIVEPAGNDHLATLVAQVNESRRIEAIFDLSGAGTEGGLQPDVELGADHHLVGVGRASCRVLVVVRRTRRRR